jgi:hypothetical protein
MPKSAQKTMVLASVINQKIYFLRGTRIMLDSDLAKLYGVTTANLNKAVARNRERFPADFMFRMSAADQSRLIFQIGISKSRGGRGGNRFRPYVFTEQGVAMLSSVLRSQRAVQVNVAIMRTFVRLREMLSTHEDLRRKIDALEKRYDARFQAVFETIRQMLETPNPAKKSIGFHANLQAAKKSLPAAPCHAN